MIYLYWNWRSSDINDSCWYRWFIIMLFYSTARRIAYVLYTYYVSSNPLTVHTAIKVALRAPRLDSHSSYPSITTLYDHWQAHKSQEQSPWTTRSSKWHCQSRWRTRWTWHRGRDVANRILSDWGHDLRLGLRTIGLVAICQRPRARQCESECRSAVQRVRVRVRGGCIESRWEGKWERLT